MVKYYDRKQNTYETEKVAGAAYLNWIYSSPAGLKLLEAFVKKKLFTRLYGQYCDSFLSKRKVRGFIKEFGIDMDSYRDSIEDFKCFNDFFTRRLLPEARLVCEDRNILVSPAEGRVLAYQNIRVDELVQVKGFTYSLKDLIRDALTADKYDRGACLVVRLCPTDYHRFHFIDDGNCDKTNKIKGFYYSVNPAALEKVKRLFCENKREWGIFHSQNFGDVLYVEVGATCVGSIVQTYTPGKEVERGEEKGYFKFGGSTVILFFQRGTVTLDKDILEQTALGFETRVLMGEKVGIKG